ncbi:hypothetical protein ACOMHN_059374 [Nucella lapillus]
MDADSENYYNHVVNGTIPGFDPGSHSVSADVKGVSANVNSVSADVNSVSADVNSVSADVNSVSADVNSVSAYVNSVSADVNSVSADVTSASADVNSRSANVNSVSADVNSVSADVNSVSADVNSVSANVNSVSADVNSVSADVNSVSADVNSVSANVNSVSADVNSVSADVNSVSAYVKSESADVNSVSADVNSVFASVNSVSASVNSVSASVNSVPASVKSVSADVNSVSADVNSVSADVESGFERLSYRITEEDNNIIEPDNQDSLGDGPRYSRLLLAKSAAQTLMANKPGQPEVTVTGPGPQDIDTLSVPWDAPLRSARHSALSPEIDGSGYISPCSIYSIEADLTAEKEEFLDEEDKHELARRLEEELAGSILELWRERLNQPMMASDIEIAYDTDDNLSTASHTPRSTCSRSPASRSPIVSLGHKAGARALAFLKGRRSRTGSVQSDDSDEGGSSLEVARMRLRKTRFDYDKDTLRKPKDVTPQVDFRNVLKKGAKPLGD